MHQRRVGIIIFFVVFLFGLFTMSRGIITWDEPENYFVGRIYLNILWTQSLGPLRNPTSLRIPQALPFRADTHWERYPPLAITLASFSSLVWSEWLHLTDPVSAHHMVVVLFSALAVYATYAMGLELTGSVFLGGIAALILALSPIFLGHSQVNIKDVPQAALFTLSVWLGMRAIRANTLHLYLVAGVVWGLAMATKFNAVFVPIILGIWFIVQKKNRLSVRQIGYFTHYGIVGMVVLCVFWPWIVTDPVRNIRMIVQYVGEVGRGLPVLFDGILYIAGVDVPWWYAPSVIALQTPPVVLLFIFVGIIASALGMQAGVARKRIIVFIWIGVVFGRYMVPHMIIYNGARHVMEVLPALALLAMFGVEWLVKTGARWVSIQTVKTLCLVVLVVALGYVAMRMHPYESMYFNIFAGESKKVSETFDFDYWGFSVGELVTKVNNVARGTDATVYVAWLNFPSAYFPDNTLAFVQSETEGADFIIIPNSQNFFEGAIAYWNTHGKVVSTVARNDVVIGYLFATKK